MDTMMRRPVLPVVRMMVRGLQQTDDGEDQQPTDYSALEVGAGASPLRRRS